jgi:predicted RNase H-like HicB family nuclease
MRLISTLFGAACLLCGCAGDGTNSGGSARYVYSDWLYYEQDWYDDEFWVWVDDHPDCCAEQDDLEEALQDWYDGLNAAQQQVVRDRVQTWMDEHEVVPAAGQSAKELVLETASQRWAALTPVERQQWLDQRRARMEQRPATDSASRLTSAQPDAMSERAASLSPEQRAALRESAQGMSFDRFSGRGRAGAYGSTSRHPTPGRAGLSGGARFQAARGGGGGGRGGRGR